MERRALEHIFLLLRTFFPLIDVNDILEKEWWLMTHLKLGYLDLESMPLEYMDWLYDRELKDYLEKQGGQTNSGLTS